MYAGLCSGIYVCGDLTGFSLLAHTAVREAEVAVHTILGQKDAMSYWAIPGGIYQSGDCRCGANGRSSATKRYQLSGCKASNGLLRRFVAENEGVNGVCKLLIADDKTIVGAHVLGNPASEIITLAGMAIELKLTTTEWKKIIFPHPTVSEIFKEAL